MLCFGLLALCIHFSLLLVFTNPYREAGKKLDYYAQWYVYPYFSQNWNLFVPPPSTNYRLFVEYEQNGLQRKDIFEELEVKHQANRFKGYGSLLLAFSNSIHFFEKNTARQKPLNGPVSNDLYFRILENSVENYLKATCGQDIKHIRLRLMVSDIHSGGNRVYFN